MAFGGDKKLKTKIEKILYALRKDSAAAADKVAFFKGKKSELTLIFVYLYRLSDKQEEAEKMLHDTIGIFPTTIKTTKIEDITANDNCIVNQPTSYNKFLQLLNSINTVEGHVKDQDFFNSLKNDFIGFTSSLTEKKKADSDDAAVAESVRGKMYRPTYHTEANSDGDGRTSYRKGNVFGTTGFGRLGKSKKTRNDDDSSDVSADEESSNGSAGVKLKSVVKKYKAGVVAKESWDALLDSIRALLTLIRKPSDINALVTGNPDIDTLSKLNENYSKLKNETFLKKDDMGKLAALHCFMNLLFELLVNGIRFDEKTIKSKKKEILDKIDKNKAFGTVLKNSGKTFAFFWISIKVNGENMIIFVKNGTIVYNVLDGLFELVGGDSYYIAFAADHRYGGHNDKKKYKKAPNGDIKEDNGGKPLKIGKDEWIELINSAAESDKSKKIDCTSKNYLTQIPLWEFGDKGHFKDLGGRKADHKFLLKT